MKPRGTTTHSSHKNMQHDSMLCGTTHALFPHGLKVVPGPFQDKSLQSLAN